MEQHSKYKGLNVFLFLLLLLASFQVSAHTVNYALENTPAHHVVWYYVKLGFQHIIPDGLDHILFVIGLCLLSTGFKNILWMATAFTIAHTITLALSMNGTIALPGALVEPIIGLSILFIAIENLVIKELKPWRIAVVFAFGLIHGLGFANALNEIGLPPNRFFTSLIAFNAGVELGQIAVITAVFGLCITPWKSKAWYQKRLVYPISILIAVIASYWTITRM